ncbi:MAG TPA: tetratricopeptide repeat protein [Terriglobales bacterium]|nr:tetratricopeptide repeat protein [Terriglobales bacterium]
MMTGRLRLTALLALVLAVATVASATTPEQLIDDGHYKQARSLVDHQLQANPNNAQLNWLMARIHRAFGDLPGAIGYAQKAVQLAPSKADYHLTLAELQGRVAEQSNMLKQAMLARTIRKELETAFQLEPSNVDARWGLLQYYWMAPSLMGGDKAKAREMAVEIGKLNVAQGYVAQAVIAADEKRTSDVESNYKKAIQADPNSYDARISLAQFYMGDDQKKYDEAAEQYRAATKISPTRVDGYVGLSKIYAMRGQWTELERLLGESEHQISDNMLPYYEAGLALLNSGKELGRAEQYLRKYMGQEVEGNAPSLPDAHWRLSQVLTKEGRRPEAIAELNTAVKMNPGFEPAKKDLKKMHG